MRPDESGSPRLMFVLTAAFGELFNAMYMVMGCGFRTTFAMREPWYSLNRSGLPGTSYRFENIDSLMAAIEQENPDLVCLFSGYLYASDKIIEFGELDRLLKYLHDRRIKTVTSDPFLGLISRLPPLDHESPIGQILGLPMRLIGGAAFGSQFPYFLRARFVLKDLPHVYIVDPDERGIKALPFYNPNILSYASESTAAKEAMNETLPMGRLVATEEIAGAIAYLASPLSGASVGTVLAVDGGIHGLRMRPSTQQHLIGR